VPVWTQRSSTVFAAGLVLVAAALGWLSAVRGGLPLCAAALLVLGVGIGAAMQSSSNQPVNLWPNWRVSVLSGNVPGTVRA
jgi:hypothetical protein